MLKYNKRLILCAAVILSLLILPSCSSVKYRDGTYSAVQAEFAASGWKDTVEITIENGELIKISWDSIYKDESIPIRKKQYSKSGLYGMLKGGAVGEWYDQTAAAEQFVLQNGVDALKTNSDGYTDAVSGCTIHVNGFESLLRECLKKAEK